MMAAFTTAAVANFSMHPPEKSSSPLDWMPNHRDSLNSKVARPKTEAEMQAESDYELLVLERAAELRAEQAARSASPHA